MGWRRSRGQRGNGQLPVTGGRVGVMTYGGVMGFQELELWDVGSVTKTYSSGGQRVALRRDGTLYYVHTDHLGSTSLLTDATGAEVPGTRLRYFAYGAPRPGTADATHNAFARGYTPATYTGQTRDAGTGLMYYGARWYDPALGRFISPDTIVPNLGDPQSLNRYSYVGNQPLKYTDPTGHEAICTAFGPTPIGLLCEVAMGVAKMPAGQQILQQAESLVVQHGAQLTMLAEQASHVVSQQVAKARASSTGGSSNANPGGLGPNDPWNRFGELLKQGNSEFEAAVKASTQGSGDGFIIGPYNTPPGTPNYIQEGNRVGARYFDAGRKLWDQLAQKNMAKEVNREVIRRQMEAGISRIDISSGLTIDDVLRTMPKSWTAQEVTWIEEFAQKFGYIRNVVNTGWIKVP